jgi:hypothetical protein
MFLVRGQRTDAYPSAIGGHHKITSKFVYWNFPIISATAQPSACKSTNDAMTTILTRRFERCEFIQEFQR